MKKTLNYQFKLGQTDQTQTWYKVTEYEKWEPKNFNIKKEEEWSGLYCGDEQETALGYRESLYEEQLNQLNSSKHIYGYLQEVKIPGSPVTILEISVSDEKERNEFTSGNFDMSHLKKQVKNYLNSANFNDGELFMKQMGELQLLVLCPHSGGKKELIVPEKLKEQVTMTKIKTYEGEIKKINNHNIIEWK